MLELVHAYSLMHDDLPCMDDAELRRGRPTPHTLFGEAATVRAGQALIPAASLHALRATKALGCDDDTARSVVRELNRAAGAGGPSVGGGGGAARSTNPRGGWRDGVHRPEAFWTRGLVTRGFLDQAGLVLSQD